MGFLLVSAGCAIGIGNVWRFPYVTGKNGGGYFVLFYILCLLIMGVPVLTMELAVGRASHKSAILAYKTLEKPKSKWHIHGWFCLIGCYLLMMYYTTVSGWMVTYFKGSGIIAGTLAAYTVTVMWGATLVGRLLIAFVFPFKKPRKAMVGMSVLCTVFYVLLVMAHTQGAAIALLFAFAISMSGLNPTAVASAGRMTSVTSMGIMLPVASSGAILMPWTIGMVAERAGLAAGMASNIVPCVGLVVFAILVAKLPEE